MPIGNCFAGKHQDQALQHMADLHIHRQAEAEAGAGGARGVAAMQPGSVMEPWPISMSAKVGAHPARTA